MEQSQIEEFKTTLKGQYENKINSIREEMEQVFASLAQAGKTLTGINTVGDDAKPEEEKIKGVNGKHLVKATPVMERMKEALEQMPGDFSRQELFEMVRNDHTGINSPDGTLSVMFCRLVGGKEIVATLEARGTIPGRYKWAGKKEKSFSESSHGKRSNVVMGGKGGSNDAY